jgi:O-antigen/teichoic acid export membrane protein
VRSSQRNLLVRIAARMGWGIADQGLSSFSNFVLGVVVARTVGLTDFGAFSLAFAAYLLVTGFSRAVNAQPLLIRYSGVDDARWRQGAGAATGSALLIGLACAVIALLIALATAGAVHEAFLALAVMLPGLAIQDSWRFAFFAHGQGRNAFLTDLTWTLVQLPALLVASIVGHSVFWFVVAWGGAAGLAALVGVVLSGVVPRPAMARSWYREHQDLLPPYIGEFGANQLAGQLFLYAVGVVSGLAVVGTLRAAQILVGPLYVVVQGSYLVAVPEAVRVAQRSGRRLLELCALAAAGLAGVGVAWGLVLEFVPDAIGTALIGEVWAPVHQILLVWALSFGAVNIGIGALIGLRALAAAGPTFRAAVIANSAGFIGGVGGAALGGAQGATWGYLVAQVFGAAVWWYELRGVLRRHRPADAVEAPAAPEISPL